VPITPERTRQVAAAARRRHAASLIVGACGTGLAAGAALGLVIVSAARVLPILPLDARWPWLIAATVLAVALALTVAALARPWSRLRAAKELDRRLELRDRLGTAIELSERPAPGVEPPFIELALREAERVAAGVEPARAVPIRWGRSWLAGAVLLLLALAVGLWMPRLDLIERQARERALHAAQVRESIAQALDVAQSAAGERAPAGDAASAPELQAIREIERELAAGRASPEQARAETARHLQTLAERLESAARQQHSRSEAVKDALSRARRAEGDEESDDIARALRQGDFAAAARAAEELARDLPRLSPDQRRRVAEQLRDLSDALESHRRSQYDSPDQPDLSDQPAPDQPTTQPTLTPPGSKPPSDRPDADQTPPPDDVDRLREALRDAARAVERAPDPPAAPPDRSPTRDQTTTPPEPTREAQPEPADKGRPADQKQPDRPDEPSDRPGDRKVEGQPATRPREKPPPAGAPEPQHSPQGQPGSGQPQPTPRGQPEPGPDQPAPAQPTPRPDSPRIEPGAGPEPVPQPRPAPDQSPRPVPGDRPEDQPRADRPGTPDDPRVDAPRPDAVAGEGMPEPREGSPDGPPPDLLDEKAVERLAEQLRRLEQMDESARRRLSESRSLREQAERLLRQMSPRDRERLEELARRWGGDPSAPGSDRSDQPAVPEWAGPTEVVDARPRAEPARGVREAVISEWLTPAVRDPDAIVQRQVAAERFREAARGAERAVEQQAVPLQHRDLVRRVFNRYTERASAIPEPR
jgi:hypothetical protein